MLLIQGTVNVNLNYAEDFRWLLLMVTIFSSCWFFLSCDLIKYSRHDSAGGSIYGTVGGFIDNSAGSLIAISAVVSGFFDLKIKF